LNIFKNISKLFTSDLAIKSDGFAMQSQLPYYGDSVTSTPLLSAQQGRLSSAVSICLKGLALGLSEAKLSIYDKDNNPLDLKYPLAQLIAKPNSKQTTAQFSRQIVVAMALTGDCYVRKIRDKNGSGLCVGMRALSGDVVDPQIVKKTIVGYRVFGESGVFPVEDFIHIPWALLKLDSIFGYSPVDQVIDEITADKKVAEYLRYVLKNGARIPGVITQNQHAGGTTPATLKQFGDDFNAEFSGQGQGRTAVLPKGMEYQKVSLTPNELAIGVLNEVPETRIAAAFGVPPEIVPLTVGIKNSTYSNKREAMKSFVNFTLSPLWKDIAEALNQGLKDEFQFGGTIYFDTSDVKALKEDEKERRDYLLSAFEKSVLSRHYVQQELNADVQGVDGFFIDLQQAKATQLKEFKSLSEGIRHKDSISEVALENLDEFKYWQGMVTIIEDGSTKLFNALQHPIQELRDEVTKTLGVKSYNFKKDVPFDYKTWAKRFLTATEYERKSLAKALTEASVVDVGESWGDWETKLDNAIREALIETADKITDSVGTIKDQLQTLVVAIGDDKTRLADEIQHLFDIVATSRAMTIANTTGTALQGATQKWAKTELNKDRAADKKLKRQWTAQLDGKARSSHQSANGQKEDEEGFFTVAGYRTPYPAGSGLPAKEACNCRCLTRLKVAK
jgi:HK97 family phage portal protein